MAKRWSKVQTATGPIACFLVIPHPDEFQHAIGKLNAAVSRALTGMGVAWPFSKALGQQPISHLSTRLNQNKDVVHIYGHTGFFATMNRILALPMGD